MTNNLYYVESEWYGRFVFAPTSSDARQLIIDRNDGADPGIVCVRLFNSHTSRIIITYSLEDGELHFDEVGEDEDDRS